MENAINTSNNLINNSNLIISSSSSLNSNNSLMLPLGATSASLNNQMMKLGLSNNNSTKQLLENTPSGVPYNALYLCSVTTLPEASGRGSTFELCMQTIDEIIKTHPLEFLFVWPFTKAGEALANKIANASGLKLLLK